MRNAILLIFTTFGLLAFGQEYNIDQIENEVKVIETDSALKKTEFDLEEFGIFRDGGGILKVWHDGKQICKIIQEIGLSYGQIHITIYLFNGIPVKIIEVEENFELTSDGLNYEKLNEVYRQITYVFDWYNDNAYSIRTGKRNMSEASCSMYELAESMIEMAKKATDF